MTVGAFGNRRVQISEHNKLWYLYLFFSFEKRDTKKILIFIGKVTLYPGRLDYI